MVDRRRMHVAMTNPNKYFIVGNSLNKFKLKNDDLSLFVMGLLNSKLLDWTFRKTSTNNHVNCYELEQLPIKIPNNRKPFEDIISKIINKGDDDIYELENILDILIYRLYELPYSWAQHINEKELSISEEEYNKIIIE